MKCAECADYEHTGVGELHLLCSDWWVAKTRSIGTEGMATIPTLFVFERDLD